MTQEIDNRSTEIQKSIHNRVEEAMKLYPGKVSYQDATNVCIFDKLAELELRIEEQDNIIEFLKYATL